MTLQCGQSMLYDFLFMSVRRSSWNMSSWIFEFRNLRDDLTMHLIWATILISVYNLQFNLLICHDSYMQKSMLQSLRIELYGIGWITLSRQECHTEASNHDEAWQDSAYQMNTARMETLAADLIRTPKPSLVSPLVHIVRRFSVCLPELVRL